MVEDCECISAKEPDDSVAAYGNLDLGNLKDEDHDFRFAGRSVMISSPWHGVVVDRFQQMLSNRTPRAELFPKSSELLSSPLLCFPARDELSCVANPTISGTASSLLCKCFQLFL